MSAKLTITTDAGVTAAAPDTYMDGYGITRSLSSNDQCEWRRGYQAYHSPPANASNPCHVSGAGMFRLGFIAAERDASK